MSRVGRQPISIPDGVKVELDAEVARIKGTKGELTGSLPDGISVAVRNGEIHVERASDEKRLKSLHGLTRSLIANMVEGVTEGFSKTLEIIGIGYRAETVGSDSIKFNLGYSNPIDFSIPDGITVEVEDRGTKLTVRGIDRQLVGEVAASIRKLRPPDSYKGKGIRYEGERIRLKPGKAGAARTE